MQMDKVCAPLSKIDDRLSIKAIMLQKRSECAVIAGSAFAAKKRVLMTLKLWQKLVQSVEIVEGFERCVDAINTAVHSVVRKIDQSNF